MMLLSTGPQLSTGDVILTGCGNLEVRETHPWYFVLLYGAPPLLLVAVLFYPSSFTFSSINLPSPLPRPVPPRQALPRLHLFTYRTDESGVGPRGESFFATQDRVRQAVKEHCHERRC
ncbi:hypothetical protein E2C01_073644 [Portunus trituberculatus]|uniref:Uncharacterized protein n=1 Tax=Portunus trituberculatus TaxID=210409 RepID=A0A5B7I187_PORTR|nr:hypothetical protein [Portunus trituberculatus]